MQLAAETRAERQARAIIRNGVGDAAAASVHALRQAGTRCRLEHGDDVGAAVDKLDGGLQAERAVAGDHDASARR